AFAGERRVEIDQDHDFPVHVDVLVVVPAVFRSDDPVADEDKLRVGDARQVHVRVRVDAQIGLDAIHGRELDLAAVPAERDARRRGAFAGAELRLVTRRLRGGGRSCGSGEQNESGAEGEGGHGGASYSTRASRTGVSARIVACGDWRVGLAAPVAPRADVQLGIAHTRELQREQGVAGGDPAAARGDHLVRAAGAEPLVDRLELFGRAEAPVLQIPAERRADRTRNVAGAFVDRLDLAAV